MLSGGGAAPNAWVTAAAIVHMHIYENEPRVGRSAACVASTGNVCCPRTLSRLDSRSPIRPWLLSAVAGPGSDPTPTAVPRTSPVHCAPGRNHHPTTVSANNLPLNPYRFINTVDFRLLSLWELRTCSQFLLHCEQARCA